MGFDVEDACRFDADEPVSVPLTCAPAFTAAWDDDALRARADAGRP